MSDMVRYSWQPELRRPTLIAGWAMDAGRLGTMATDYLIRKLDGQAFCDIEPVDFFPLGGVTIANDIVLFPESRFYACVEQDIIIFQSPPSSQLWYRFLNLVLDVAESFHVKEVYTVGSMISFGPHTSSRQFYTTTTSAEVKADLSEYGLDLELDYETPPGGKPTLNSFLLWAARRRGIPGAGLWVPVPFYLISVDDPEAYRKPLGFLKHRLGLEIDLTELDDRVGKQNEKLDRMRTALPEVDRLISRLEEATGLDEDEGEKLAQEVEAFLRENAD